MREAAALRDGQLAPPANFESRNTHRPDCDAHQLQHFTVNGFNHAPYLAVAAFSDLDFEKGVFLGVAQPADRGRTRGPVFKRYTGAQVIDLLICDSRGTLYLVGLGHFVMRIGEQLGKTRIIGHDKKAAGIQIETPDREDPGIEAFEKIVNCRAPFRILIGGDVTFRFVKQQVLLFRAFERLAIEKDPVAVEIDPLVRVFYNPAIDADPPRPDPAPCFGAAAEPRLGENALQCFQPLQGRTTLAWLELFA